MSVDIRLCHVKLNQGYQLRANSSVLRRVALVCFIYAELPSTGATQQHLRDTNNSKYAKERETHTFAGCMLIVEIYYRRL